MPRKFYTWVTLVGEFEAEDDAEAFEMMMEAIANRDGLDISSHEIIEKENSNEDDHSRQPTQDQG